MELVPAGWLLGMLSWASVLPMQMPVRPPSTALARHFMAHNCPAAPACRATNAAGDGPWAKLVPSLTAANTLVRGPAAPDVGGRHASLLAPPCLFCNLLPHHAGVW